VRPLPGDGADRGPRTRPRRRLAAAGIRRRRRGRGFSFGDAEGTTITDEDTLERIRDLAIPPAWKEVWICPDPLGHIQATGLDEPGRKQYRYHNRWDRRRATRKYAAMREFAAALPKLRRAVRRDIELKGMPRERALATAVRLLDLGFFRIGGEEYAETNESYGLATIRRENVHREGEEIVFDLPAKSNRLRIQAIGAELSAKDFRTWSGTVLAAAALAGEERPASEAAAKRTVAAAGTMSERTRQRIEREVLDLID
jgi:DNA topoisomerase I